ncbi:membrane cofactor protein isoform X4 [Loxodonta africana]|uniref:membrane cofactor protein isoform X4 n=1 Tax=Loxodonta africana TaxID=9785 RepID=UPI0030CA9A1F
MTVSAAPPTAPACRRESPFTSWCSLGAVLMSVVFHLLIKHTDACGAPTRYETMKLRDPPKDHYTPGESVVYQCRLGYRIKPSFAMTAVCNDSNSWTPLQEACAKKLCSNPGDPVNGRVIQTNGTLEFGSQVDYVCDEGYRLIGEKTSYCYIYEDSVAWSSERPECNRIMCAPPPNIENGQYRNSEKEVYEYNEVVHYSCRSADYSLIGNERLICSTNGEWSTEPPKCKVVKCPFPRVDNADRIAGFGTKFVYKSKVVFQCHEGFVMNGSDTITCEGDSLWVPPVPQCVKVSTPPSTKPPILSHPATTTISPAPPGHAPSTKQPPISSLLDGGSIAVIVIAVSVGVVVVSIFLYKYRHHRKRGRTEVTAKYRTCKEISATPAEQKC